MIKRFASLVILSVVPLLADYDLDDASTFQMPSEEEQQPGAFTLKGFGDVLGKAQVRRHGHNDGKITYAHAQGEFDAVIYYNPCCKEGVSVGLGYEYTRLKWNHNSFFCKDDYNIAFLSFVFFTNRVPCWRWLFSANINIDANKWEFNDYTNYDLLFWGRYEYNCLINLHAGIYVETGMKMDRVFPVIGFDWQINDKLFLSAVYPLNMSLNYKLNCRWTLALAIRIFTDRHRAGDCGFLSKAIWRYSNTGTEVALNYNLCDRFTASAHIGYAWGGNLRIANRHNHHVHHVKFNSSGYVGGAISYNF